MDHINESLTASKENLNYLAKKRPQPQLTSYFCAEIVYGVLGFAFMRSACLTDGHAVNIVELFSTVNTDIKTAKVWAHELGHTIAMK